jgi:hexosaminidase
MFKFPKESLVCLLAAVFFVSNAGAQHQTGISIIPAPARIEVSSGGFWFTQKTLLVADSLNSKTALYFSDYLRKYKNLENKIVPEITANDSLVNTVLILTNKGAEGLKKEGYHLKITNRTITIVGNQAGLFYGIQSLIQLFPQGKTGNVKLPRVTIEDYPRFGYRGMMLDVARHFYSVENIKKYLDYLAMHKINTFHWHLTDDHGWRIEIKKYPGLTRVASWRKGTQITMNPFLIDKTPHGGFYTQDQIREIVAYAGDRFITVIPEIEMPGHSLEVLVAYPELSCTGGPFEMPLAWGLTRDIFCAGKENTFKFIEDVLSEVAALFPGPYIHIGGDEAPKDRWKVCPECQARMKQEGLSNEHELQSYFTKRIQNFLLTKNKRVIGWDEILEGGIAPGTTVMSYRGTKTGIEAAKQHHEVIMSPSTYLYFDYYQGEPSSEPHSIGNFLPLKKVYSYEPSLGVLSADEAKFVLGVQANLWTEFVPAFKSVEYMTMPRIAALSEIAWSLPQNKDWEDFKRRMEFQYLRYREAGINYAGSASYVSQKISVDPDKREALVSLSTDDYNPVIYYTTGGSLPSRHSLRYQGPFRVSRSATVQAVAYNQGRGYGKVSRRSFVIHKAIGKKVSVKPAGSGVPGILTNGLKALEDYRDKEWFRVKERDFIAVIDLGSKVPVKNITATFLHNTDQFIFVPEYVEYAVSDDSITFRDVARVGSRVKDSRKGPVIQEFNSNLSNTGARYIKVYAKNSGVSPDSHYAPGQKLWIYAGEIIVN